MEMSQTTIYLVQKRWWWSWEDGNTTVYQRVGEEGGSPVRAFTDRDRAEEFCRAQEQAMRADANPFLYGDKLEDLSSLEAAPFHDWLLDAGLTPWSKTSNFKNYRAWWFQVRREMTDLQRARVWEALDKVRFFEIVELEGRV